MCIFQLLLFYIFTVLLNVNSSPSDISLNSSHQAAYCIIISTHNWVVATHAAFWKSYSLKNLMRLSLPLHCALQCFGKLSRGAHFNSVMSVKYEVKLTASLERCHDDFTLWHGILNSQYLTCRWEKHSLYIFISIMNIIFYILSLSSIQWKDWVWKPSLPFGSRKICSLHTTNTESAHSHVAFAVLFTWTLIINHENTQCPLMTAIGIKYEGMRHPSLIFALRRLVFVTISQIAALG